jgi:hypothetical protein
LLDAVIGRVWSDAIGPGRWRQFGAVPLAKPTIDAISHLADAAVNAGIDNARDFYDQH